MRNSFAETKEYCLRGTDYRVSSTNMFYQFSPRTIISTTFKALDSNPVWAGGSAYGYCISDFAMKVDGDLLICVGWRTGFNVLRIADNGTLTSLYQDTTPNNSYTYYTSLAVDKVRGLAFVGNFVYDNLRKYDYSGVQNGGAGSVTDEGQLTEAGNNLPSDEVGHSYKNGLLVVGDYLYIVPDDKTTTTQLRWNTQTETADNITVVNVRNAGRYGTLYYDADNDRVYTMNRNDGEIWVTTDPSSATPTAKTYCIRINALGIGDDCMFIGVVPDKDNSNHLWVAGNYRFAKIDITNCIKDVGFGDPILVSGNNDNLSGPPYWVGYGEGIRFFGTHPTHKSDFIRIFANRAYCKAGGWWDQENSLPVCLLQNLSTMVISDKDIVITDYQPVPVRIQSDSGTPTWYWVYGGYGSDLTNFHVFSDANGLVLETSSDITFGTFTLDSSDNIATIFIANLENNYYTLSGTTITFTVSNDNGSSWEDYTAGSVHAFTSSGTQARFKIAMTGTEIVSSHVNFVGNLIAVISGGNTVPSSAVVPAFKLTGA